jgi:hypothetical protein
MALVKCAECGRQISDKATACPQCGAPGRQLPGGNEPLMVRVETPYDVYARLKARKKAAREAKSVAWKNASFPVKVMRFLFTIALLIILALVLASQK